jgi:phage terminase Nu1 subunit (DNA packaging protein)
MKTSSENISIQELAELSGLTVRRLYQLIEERKIPSAVNGSFPMLATVRQLFCWFRRDSENLQKEKLYLATARRKKAERENEEAEAIQSKLWFPTDKMLEMFRIVVNRFEQLPGKVRSEGGANEVYERILQKHVDDVRRQIASDIAELNPKT